MTNLERFNSNTISERTYRGNRTRKKNTGHRNKAHYRDLRHETFHGNQRDFKSYEEVVQDNKRLLSKAATISEDRFRYIHVVTHKGCLNDQRTTLKVC